MNQSSKKNTAIAITAAVILALLLSTGTVLYKNSKLKESVNNEKLQSEKLLSEKLLLTKQIDDFRKEITGLMGKNKEADLLLEKARQNLTEKEAAIHSLTKEAADAKQLKKQLTDIKKSRENLLAEIQQLHDSKQALSIQNKELTNKNEKLVKDNNSLLAENKTLAEQLKAKSFIGSNFKIEVIKNRKDKMTVKAKRTQKVKIEFEVDANSFPVDSKLVHIDLLSPEKALSSGETEVTVANQASLSASLTEGASGEASQKVTIQYIPKEDLKQGIYTVLVYHKNTFLGKAQFRLMK